VAVIIIPAAMIMSFFSQQVLWVWTGNLDLVQRVAPVLSLYALGNCIVALSTFPYYLQFAKGDLRLHLLGSLLLLVVMVPALSWSTMHFGVIGAGYAWLGANALYFLFWIPTVHGKFEKGLHTLWLLQDVGAILIPCSIVAILIYYAFAWPPGRIAEGMYTLVFGVLLLGIASASSSQIRKKIGSRLRRKFH
jgi:O-antigen/teichoic acid export membrane protein